MPTYINIKENGQTAKTIKEYQVDYYGYNIVIPVGSIVTSLTACGVDLNYRFWNDFHKVAEELTGYKDSILAHDLAYHGINIPKEYCEEYKK